jgi:hypothetical protein
LITVPAGLAFTVPLPVPAVASVSEYSALNVAVTARLADIVTVHVVLVPEQSPDHALKDDPGAGDAVSVTTVPGS